MARPRKEIDYSILQALCRILCTGEECASILGIDYDTLNRGLKREGHGGFAEYYKRHSAEGKVSLRRMQFQAAQDGNVTMQIFLGKQCLGQSDKQEISGRDGGPIKHAGTVFVGVESGEKGEGE